MPRMMKKGKRKLFIKKCAEIVADITTLAANIDSLEEPRKTSDVINLNTLLRDISKKYSHIQAVRNTIKEINDGPSMNYLLKMRNNAAHARISEKQKEITARDIELMISHLRIIIST